MIEAIIGLAALGAAHTAEAQGSDDHKQLRELNHSWLKLLESHDQSIMGAVLAEDFIGLYGDTALNRQQMLEGLLTRPDTRVSWENLKIEVRGDSAVVSANSTIVTTRDSVETTTRYNYADFYSRRSGKWKAIAARVIRLP